MADGKSRHHVFALLAALVTGLIFFVWVSIFVVNTQYVHGYPRIHANPGPNDFVSTRGTVYTVFIALLFFNGMLPYLLITAVTDEKVGELGALHSAVSALCVFIDFVVLLGLLVFAGFWCNNGIGLRNTPCNDPRACCALFGESVFARMLCPNSNICTPDVTRLELGVSGIYWGHVAFAAIFLVTAYVHLGVNRRLVVYGVLELD